MKKKAFCASLLFLVFLIINSLSNVAALGYNSGVKQNQNFVWKCNVCNELEMNTIFGSLWDDFGYFKNLSKGKKMKWEVTNIEINETFISIIINTWDWRKEENWGIIDNTSQIVYYTNPDDYRSNELNFSDYSSLVPFWFPTPIGEYLGGLNSKLIKWYDVDNRVLPTLNVEIAKDEITFNLPTKDIYIIAIYNDQGILDSYKLYTKGNVVIIDISLDFLPLYVIPSLVSLAIIPTIGIVIYIYKKRRTLVQP